MRFLNFKKSPGYRAFFVVTILSEFGLQGFHIDNIGSLNSPIPVSCLPGWLDSLSGAFDRKAAARVKMKIESVQRAISRTQFSFNHLAVSSFYDGSVKVTAFYQAVQCKVPVIYPAHY